MENLEKNVYNLDGESRRSRLGSCFYDLLGFACYNSHQIAMIHVIFLVASLESEHLQVYLQSPKSCFPYSAQVYRRSLFRSPIRSKEILAKAASEQYAYTCALW